MGEHDPWAQERELRGEGSGAALAGPARAQDLFRGALATPWCQLCDSGTSTSAGCGWLGNGRQEYGRARGAGAEGSERVVGCTHELECRRSHGAQDTVYV